MSLTHLLLLLLLHIALLSAPTLAGKDNNKDNKDNYYLEETGCKNNDKYCQDSPRGYSVIKKCIDGIWVTVGPTCPDGCALDGEAKCN
jgi:hypothetical protein